MDTLEEYENMLNLKTEISREIRNSVYDKFNSRNKIRTPFNWASKFSVNFAELLMIIVDVHNFRRMRG